MWFVMLANGPAIWGGCVTRRSIRAGSWYFSHEDVTVQGGYAVPRQAKRSRGRTFCRPGTNFIEHYACRGTKLIGAANLSLVTKLVAGTGAVLSRRSEAESGVAVQTVSEPEICPGAGFILGAGAGVRVQRLLQICLECRSKSKNRDNLPINRDK